MRGKAETGRHGGRRHWTCGLSRALLRHPGAWRCVAALLLFDWMFYRIDLTPVRGLLASAVASVLGAFDHDQTIAARHCAIAVNGRLFQISSECTYLDLVGLLGILAYRPSRSIRAHAARFVEIAAVVAASNFVRVCVALHLSSRGCSWELAHELPDLLLYWPALFVFGSAKARSLIAETAMTSKGTGRLGPARCGEGRRARNKAVWAARCKPEGR